MNLKHLVIAESKKMIRKGKVRQKKLNRSTRKKTGRKYAEMIRMVLLRFHYSLNSTVKISSTGS